MTTPLRGILGLLVGAGLLWLLFRGTDGAELAAALGDLRVGWLVLAQVCLWSACFARTQRWTYVVRMSGPASYRSVFSATQIGYLGNFLVPARAGELVRAWVLSQLAGFPLARSVAMVTLDRVNDVIGLLVVLGVAALALTGDAQVEIPPGSFGNQGAIAISSRLVRPAAGVLAAGVAAACLGLVALYAARERVVRVARKGLAPLSSHLADRAAGLLGQFAEGLHIFRSGAGLARALSWSLLTWLTDVAAVAAILAAFGVAFPWYAPFVVLALVAVAIVVPLTPGVVGQFHVPAVAGVLLAVPGLDPTRAKAIAVVDHLSTLIPIATLGLWCLFRERLDPMRLLRLRTTSGDAGVVGAPNHD